MAKRKNPPVDFDVTLSVRFGEEEDDVLLIMDDRRFEISGTVFDLRGKAGRKALRQASDVVVDATITAALAQRKVRALILPYILKLAGREAERYESAQAQKPSGKPSRQK